MDLNTLVRKLREQATNSRIKLDGSILDDETVREKIRAAFALETGADLTIVGVTADIPEPGADGVLTITGGKAERLLKQNNVQVELTFIEVNGTIDVVIVAKMGKDWTFKDSFTGLDTFPFTWLEISGARFVFSTTAHSWPDEPGSTIPLKAGLSFVSQVAPKFASSVPSPVKELIGNVSRKFYGLLTPKDGQNWPVGTLRAALTDAKFEIGDDAIKLSLGAPKLAVRISEATEDFPVQELDLMVEAEFNELQVAIAIPVTGGALELSTTPLKPGASVAALIKQLPGGNFIQYIPNELKVFDEVGLKNFSLVVNADRKVSYIGLSIDTLQSWDITVLKLEHLALKLETLEPSNLNSMRANISATADFLKPQVFAEPFDFNIELEQDTSWKLKTISGAYYGSVSLSKIVNAVLPRGITAPDELEHVEFSDFGVILQKEGTAYTYSFHGSVETVFPIMGQSFTSSLNITVTKTGNTHTHLLTGGLVIGEQVFTFSFELGKQLIATWEHKGTSLGFGEIASAFGWDSMPPMPEGLDLALKSARFSYDFDTKTVVLTAHSVNYGDIVFATFKQDETPAYFLAVDVPLGLKFSKLPLVGESLPVDPSMGVDKIQLIVASEKFDEKETASLYELIRTTLMPKSLGKGLTLAAKLELGGPHEVVLPLTDRPKPRAELPPMATPSDELVPTNGERTLLAAANYQAEPKWFELKKTLGPVHFEKVGVQYQGSAVRFLLNAALSVAGLTLSVEGLSAGSSLKKFEPEFELRGLGVEYKAGDIEIGGAFLKTASGSYDGAAVIKTKQFAISAIGSYMKYEGEPSIFIYAFLDYPLGGPAFFFITGLAAGFGYNRRLIAPSIDNVANFPLITQATGKQAAPKTLVKALESLQQYIPPTSGSIFLAVGVRFNSFKLVDSFALLTIEFGNNVAINLLGISKAVVPTPDKAADKVTPLAQVEIAWKATFNPDDGCLGIDARLTPNSYILSKDCRLTGGYAFYSWFSGPNAGDFVQTLGGYHPKFKVPDHYPKVPRLAFDWRVSNSLTIQGDAYYALTGSALMAGGHLEVLFREGELRAWLKLGADFLIAWKPYHYDASLYVNVGASYTFNINLLFVRVRATISVDVGARLHLWGPDFSGTATIDLSVISFTIRFGAGASQSPPPLKAWTDFQNSFLPEQKNVCSISVKDGLVRSLEAEGKQRWVINPKEFSLVVDSAIPLKSAPALGGSLKGLANVDFGVGPMAVKKEAFKTSNLTISITKNSVPSGDDDFKYTLVKKIVPAGLWGESATPSLTGEKFLKDVATGIEIRPGSEPTGGNTSKIDLKEFEYSTDFYHGSLPDGNAFKWGPAISYVRSKDLKDPQSKRAKIRDTIASNNKRAALLSELGLPFRIKIRQEVADELLSAPQIGTLEPCQPQ